MNPLIELTDMDRRIWREELEDFVPQRVFDAHSHIYQWSSNTDPDKERGAYRKFVRPEFEEAGRELLDACDAALMPGREVHRLAFPFPFSPSCDFASANRYIAEQTAGDRQSAALMLVRPQMTAEEI